MKFALLSLLLAAGLAGPVIAEDGEAPLEQVKRLLRSAIEESKKTHDYGTQILIQNLESLEGRGPVAISVIGPMRTEPTEYALTATIDEIEILSRSPKIQADCRVLRPKLRAEMEAQDAELAAKIKQGVTDALKQALGAKNAKDLEAPRAALEKLLIEGRIHGENKSYQAAEGARGFHIEDLLEHMQDVLSMAGRPNRRLWHDLNDNRRDTSYYMPRSEYLERFAQFRRNNRLPRYFDFENIAFVKVRELVRAIPSPDGIAKALEQMNELSRFDESDYAGHYLIANTKEILESYQQIHLDLTQGRATKIDASTTPLVIPQLIPAFMMQEPPPEPQTSNRADIGYELARLRDQLVLQALPRVLGLAKPADATETIPSYLQRVANQAQQDADWNLLLRILEMKQTLRIGVPPETVDTISALRAFVSGLNQEHTQDYVAATQSFQAVLQTGAQVPPAELVGGHLERLRNKHAQEFQRAMSRPETPPSDPNAGQYSLSHLLYQQEIQRPKSFQLQPPVILTVPAAARAK